MAGAAIFLVAAVAATPFLVSRFIAVSSPTAWAALRTEDVHSLAFVGGDPQRLLFGSHAGLLATADGGRTWAPLPLDQDAMSVSPAADDSILIAGHDVFAASRDGGRSWSDVRGDLPSRDIHGFTRDPDDPSRMWAALAAGGLWESTDGGAHFAQVRSDNVVLPTAVRVNGSTRLLAVDATGLNASDDGGRTWMPLGSPPSYPMTAFAASDGGMMLYAGSPDGLYRSTDAGRTWTETGYRGSAFALAVSTDGLAIGLVSQDAAFYRSPDGGATWPGPGG